VRPHSYFTMSLSPTLSALLSTEDFFTRIIKVPFVCSQIMGYLPLTIAKCPETGHLRLCFKTCSISFIGTLLQLLVSIIFLAGYVFLYPNFKHALSNASSDGISLGIMSSITFINFFTHRFMGLCSVKAWLELWKSHCYLWNEYFKIDLLAESRFMKLRSFYRNISISVLSLALIYFALVTTTSIILSFLDVPEDAGFVGRAFKLIRSIDNNTGLGWSLILFSVTNTIVVYCHPAGILWVTVFPEMYCVNLDIITDKITELNNQLMTQNTARISSNDKIANNWITSSLKIPTFASDGNFDSGSSEILETSLTEITEMYHCTVEMVKKFNSNFSRKIIVDILYYMFQGMFFSYFLLVWITNRSYISAATNFFQLLMSFIVIYYLGTVGSQLTTKQLEVLEALHRLPISRMSLCMKMQVLCRI